MTVRLAVVDDQALVRAGITAVLDAQPDLEVVGQATDGREAVTLAIATRPDVMLMDIRMPNLDGIAATGEIVRVLGADAPAILVLTTFDLDENIFDALRAGAAGFLVKDTPPEELIHAVRVLAAGEALLGPSITRRLITTFLQAVPAARTALPASAELQHVTLREREVLALVAQGLDNTEIAERLYVSVATVKSHLGRAFTKLNLTSRAQAVVFAYEAGLVPRPGL